MYKVKITIAPNSDFLFSQTPGSKGISKCGKYQFFIDQEVDEPDFWIVRNKYIKRKTTYRVAPENTILMTSEPRSIVNFPKKYCTQFEHVYSCQDTMKHKNVTFGPAALPWFIGLKWNKGKVTHSYTYDDLKSKPIPPKNKLISVITSNKAFTRGHQDRIQFVAKLKQHYGNKIDVFGRGINDFEDKWDILAPYKYHIALENSSSKYYWTEKISDCFLTGTFPIYYGCTNIKDYFPEKSFRTIDINNFDNAIQTIDDILKNDIYTESIEALEESKNLVLENYNLFNIIAHLCDRLNPNLTKKSVTLKPAITLLDHHNFYLYFIERNYYKITSLFNKPKIFESKY